MTIKHKEIVERYVDTVTAMRNAVEKLAECVESLPAPDCDGELPGMDYGHLGTLSEIRYGIVHAMRHADSMCSARGIKES